MNTDEDWERYDDSREREDNSTGVTGMSTNGIIADSASVNKGASMNLVVITTIAAFALVAVAAFFVYRSQSIVVEL